MFKYVTINGDVYVKVDRWTLRKTLEYLAVKCRHLQLIAYRFIQ